MSSPGPLDYLTALYRPSTPGALLAYAKLPTFTRLIGYPSGLHKFAERMLELDKAHDVYLTVNTLDSKAIQARGEFARGLETEVAAVVALVADVDAEKPKHNYPPQSVILNTLADMPLQPSVIVVSGRADGGLHPYWLLAEPFTIRTEADRDRIKRVSKEWQRLLKSKLAPYELDSTFDLVRVLRPIGTTNKKYGSTVSAACLRARPPLYRGRLRAPPTQARAGQTVDPATERHGWQHQRAHGPLRGHHTRRRQRAGRTRRHLPRCGRTGRRIRPLDCRSPAHHAGHGIRLAIHLGAKASCFTNSNRPTPAPSSAENCWPTLPRRAPKLRPLSNRGGRDEREGYFPSGTVERQPQANRDCDLRRQVAPGGHRRGQRRPSGAIP